MMPATEVIDALRRGGQLWEVAPGLVGLGGPALQLLQRLEDRITGIARAAADEEWRVPPALSFA